MTTRAVIMQAAAELHPSTTSQRDAELLLMRALNKDRAWLLTHPDDTLEADQFAQYKSWIARRALHEPIQYILGEQEFFGLTFQVTPEVLIPRPETEHLVEAALAHFPGNAPLRIADIGTGSGIIAISLAHSLPQAKILALDISPAALAVAAKNAERLGVAERVEFRESDLLQTAEGEVFDAIVSNPPYVATTEDLEPQVRDYEPPSALYAGESGLDIYRRMIPQAEKALKPGGWLLLEIGQGQRDALAELLQRWNNVEFIDDLQGIPRIACAGRPA